jgi:hypothetical protein
MIPAERPDTVTLMSASNLAVSLSDQRKYTEAERINREVLGARRRVLGEEHPGTRLNTANSLEVSLSDQRKHAEAEEMLQIALEVSRRVLGDDHPLTRTMAESLPDVRCAMRAEQPTKRGGIEACGAAQGADGRVTALCDSPLSATALAEAEAQAAAAAHGGGATCDARVRGLGGSSWLREGQGEEQQGKARLNSDAGGNGGAIV